MILDLRGLSDVTDYFLICHGSSDRQALAIAESIDGALRHELDIRAAHVEGRSSGEWILMDYIDFVVHVFREDRREYYRLEKLWGDAIRLDASDPEAETRQAAGGPGSAPG